MYVCVCLIRKDLDSVQRKERVVCGEKTRLFFSFKDQHPIVL